MKKIIYQKRFLILDVILVITLVGSSLLYFNSKNTSFNKNISNQNISQKEKNWETIEVKTAKDFSSIKIPAKIKSNQFAIISPRRAGIIQDLLVDIGNNVYKGQTIGSMLPEGVEGQSSAAISEASARLQKARAELANIKGVAIDSVSVATKQWRESNLQSATQSTLEQETKKQLKEKKSEAVLVATQSWENTRIILFGNGSNNGVRNIQGNFSDSIQENKIKNLSNEIQTMEESGQWNNSEKIIEHLSHLENFLVEVELLYKNAREGRGITTTEIINNLNNIQSQQMRISQIKQSILALEEKEKRSSSVQTEREAGVEKSREVIDLVQSQQNLTITQAEKNVEVALANYNAALVKAGHQSVTTPFGGIITARMVEVGQAVNTNQPLYYLENAFTTRSQEVLSEIHFSLPESWNNKISVGDRISIKTLQGDSFPGEIFRLSQQINLSTNSIVATAIAFKNLDDPNDPEKNKIKKPVDFKHGQSVFVYLTKKESEIFTVPTLSIKKRSNKYFLWKTKENKPTQIEVQVIAEDGEFSQIFTREIKEKDLIIKNPSVSLFKKSE